MTLTEHVFSITLPLEHAIHVETSSLGYAIPFLPTYELPRMNIVSLRRTLYFCGFLGYKQNKTNHEQAYDTDFVH